MNTFNETLPRRTWALAVAVCFSWALVSQAQPSSSETTRVFASPADAIKALVNATRAKDKPALHEIFGPSIREMLTGDEKQDAANFDSFTQAVSKRCVALNDGQGKCVLEIGSENWPFPIPLVHRSDGWVFDTDAGKEEIINRHIGRDELNAIGLCRAYVEAQRQFARQHPDSHGGELYALGVKCPKETTAPIVQTKMISAGGPSSLLTDTPAQSSSSDQDRTYHGYRFKVLTRQGKAAPGGRMNYSVRGKMTRGFALLAYPIQWGKSGVMTFMINQDGTLYERNLGAKTEAIAATISEYNPTSDWTRVNETGVCDWQ